MQLTIAKHFFVSTLAGFSIEHTKFEVHNTLQLYKRVFKQTHKTTTVTLRMRQGLITLTLKWHLYMRVHIAVHMCSAQAHSRSIHNIIVDR